MATNIGALKLLLLTSAIISPSALCAQDATSSTGAGTTGQVGLPEGNEPLAEGAASRDDQVTAPQEREEELDVSIPGVSDSGIVVTTSRFVPDAVRNTSEVVTLLSSEDIARTGEGDIAGALSRTTGLDVAGNGFVYVRGLGDRYSLALLNGSPLPSPEPLRRTVPLDIFPTNVISSSLVQKSYSANFPGEFGGGVINLTTKAVPTESFLSISAGVSGDTETTFSNGLSYLGGNDSDYFGFDDGSRDLPAELRALYATGGPANALSASDQAALAASLVNFRDSVLTKYGELPANMSASISAGTSIELGNDTFLGVVAAAGFSNKWRNRDVQQQSAVTSGALRTDFHTFITDNRIVANGLLSLGLEFGNNAIRWTNLYIRDTLKQARSGLGTDFDRLDSFDLLRQDSAWYERQLIDTQMVGEFELSDAFDVDFRLGYANSQREAPFENSFQYSRSKSAAPGTLQAIFSNDLGTQSGGATSSFSDLNEDLYFGGIDAGYRLFDNVQLTVGYAYSDTSREQERRQFGFRSALLTNNFAFTALQTLRPDTLFDPQLTEFLGFQVLELEPEPAFQADLTIHAGYGQAQISPLEGVSINAGVRYESAEQTVQRIDVLGTGSTNAVTNLKNDYWLPAATLTWEFAPDWQLRINGSKTIARPQFRELLFQLYFDPESNTAYRGNPLLVDSQLFNAEAQVEYYFGDDEKASIAGFYKKIDNPIESYLNLDPNGDVTSFANAPEASLYGVEAEVVKFFRFWSPDASLLGPRRLRVGANYTYTQSEVKVGANDTTMVFPIATPVSANGIFTDGQALTGQSDHLVNVQIGLEHEDRLSQQTILLRYASDRVTRRGTAGVGSIFPDIMESPGVQLDFVAREGMRLFGSDMELKLEVRNIFGTNYSEYQDFGTNIVYYNKYDVGTSFSLGIGLDF